MEKLGRISDQSQQLHLHNLETTQTIMIPRGTRSHGGNQPANTATLDLARGLKDGQGTLDTMQRGHSAGGLRGRLVTCSGPSAPPCVPTVGKGSRLPVDGNPQPLIVTRQLR